MLTLRAGDALPFQEVGPITLADIVRYAGASGDFNPLHYDEAVARDAGYPGVFAMGMLGAALMASYLGDRLGPRNVRRFGVRFRDQIWPGEVLTIGATVLDVTEVDGELRAELSVEARRPSGTAAVAGTASYVLASA